MKRFGDTTMIDDHRSGSPRAALPAGDQQMLDDAAYIKKVFLDEGKPGMHSGQGNYAYPDPAYARPDSPITGRAVSEGRERPESVTGASTTDHSGANPCRMDGITALRRFEAPSSSDDQ